MIIVYFLIVYVMLLITYHFGWKAGLDEGIELTLKELDKHIKNLNK